ncbi:GNAT family N-acetyltransferase [archaeon]|jgi:predicted N-acetyltransferase YhbS|nr:GNAT family N-acetyltransferase [archaeon]
MYEIISFEESQAVSIARLLNMAYPYDSVTPWSIVRSTVLDPNFDPSLTFVAMEDGIPIGCAIGATRSKEPKELINKEHAWLKLFVIAPDQLYSGLADRLLSQVESELRERGYKDIRATDFTGWYVFPGINVRSEDVLQFLLRKGYSKVAETTDYIIDLSGFSIPSIVKEEEERQRNEGIIYRIPDKNEKGSVASWVLDKNGPILSFETIMSFRHDPPGIIIAEKEGSIVGLGLISALETNWLGPIIVSENDQKVGEVLLYKAAWEMKLRGFDRVVIPRASESSLYAQVPNIVKVKQYWILSKNLEL